MVLMKYLFFAFLLATPRLQHKEIALKEAVQLADSFVRINGYTMAPGDSTHLQYELFDHLNKHNSDILKSRHNTLQAHAFCYYEDENAWHIGYLLASVKPNEIKDLQRPTNLPGRAVKVMKTGKEITMVHKDPLFSSFKKLE